MCVYVALGVFEVESVSSRVVFLGSPDSRRAGLFLSCPIVYRVNTPGERASHAACKLRAPSSSDSCRCLHCRVTAV